MEAGAGSGSGSEGSHIFGGIEQFRSRFDALEIIEFDANVADDKVDALSGYLYLIRNSKDLLRDMQPNIEDICESLFLEKYIRVSSVDEVNALNYLKVNFAWDGTGIVPEAVSTHVAENVIRHANSIGVPIERYVRSIGNQGPLALALA